MRGRPRRFGCILAMALLTPAPALAQAIATSPGAERVSVTIYRDPSRPSVQKMNLQWLNGVAFITEVRQVSIPAGETEIRFEGVAGGIIPQSAIVTGLPDGVIEKNRDAYLLSPASLLDRSLGKRVHIRRTSRATGKVSEEEAVIRTGAEGAVVLQTAAGFEALRCSGLAETIVYDSLPEGLSARPTLSVRTRGSRSVTATITLSYLATGFDWQANYVATLSPTEDRLDLFAWVTLANGDETSFINASTQTVAGRLNRSQLQRMMRSRGEPLHLRCWEQGTTSDVEDGGEQLQEIVVTGRRVDMDAMAMASPPPPPALELAARAQKVQQEELGDLKLYRVPEPVTVASNSQKQVALLEQRNVKAQLIYRALINPAAATPGISLLRIVKLRNRAGDGLGLPLPRGQVALFGEGYSRPVLIGEGSIDDKAVNQDVEVEFPAPPGISASVIRTVSRGKGGDFVLTVSNDRNRPIRFESDFQPLYGHRPEFGRVKMARRNGRPLWSVVVPANGTATLCYSVVED